MSDENKNPFGESTVVQSRPKAPVDSERTVVHASARAENKPAAPPKLPKATPSPEPVVFISSAVVIAAELPAKADGITYDPDTVGGAVVLRQPEAKKANSERREMREALDRKTRFAIAGVAAFAVAVIAVVVIGRGQPVTDATPKTQSQQDLASESTAPPEPESKAHVGLTDYVGTTEVLSRFDRASSRAQEKALDFSKSSSGF